ncbi:hypothetical protein K1719_040538 [Acacia pycnantha]|nr:hypothetical protein K1719_040538 [Acacia pycnantha]
MLKKQRFVSEKPVGSSTNFSRKSLDPGIVVGGRTLRWVKFWNNAAVDWRHKNSSSSSTSSPERFFEMPEIGVDVGAGETAEDVNLNRWRIFKWR